MKFNPEKYLERIAYSGSIEPTLEVLKKLQKKHLLRIPFENLDIHYNTPIKLNIDQIYDKVIVNNRGGFCYELNGLFYELLISFGFNAKRVSARVFIKDDVYTPEFDHFAIIVNLNDKEYLTDVGFGEFIFAPLELNMRAIQIDERGIFVIEKFRNDYLIISMIESGKTTPKFIFKNTSRTFSEFEGMCQYHQSNPDSHFMKKRLISRPTNNGRITISGTTIKIKENNSTLEKEIKTEKEFEDILFENFKIRLK